MHSDRIIYADATQHTAASDAVLLFLFLLDLDLDLDLAMLLIYDVTNERWRTIRGPK